MIALTVFLYFVLGATSTFISIVTLWLLYSYKADKTYVCFDEIGAGVGVEVEKETNQDLNKSQYVRALMPTSSSGIKQSSFVPSVSVDKQSIEKPQKISYKEFISGGFVKFYLIAIFVVSVIFQYSVVEYKDTNLLVRYILLPFLFYMIAVTLKKRGAKLVLLCQTALILLLSALGFFSYMKWYY